MPLVQIMTWHRREDTPLSEPNIAQICDTYASLGLNVLTLAEKLQYASVNEPSLVQIMACRQVGANPLSEPMLE